MSSRATQGAHREVGLVGLGLLGSAITRRLVNRAYTVHGTDLDAGARSRHLAAGGIVHDSAASVAEASSVVLLSLPNGSIARAACFGRRNVVEGAAPGTVVVDTTTARPQEAESLGADLEAVGMRLLDVGLSGSSPMVAQGDGVAIVGGSAGEEDPALPVLRDLCQTVFLVGAQGNGMRAKLVVNQVLAINRVAVAEALVTAEKLSLDSQLMLDVLRQSAAHSTALDIWGQRMVERRYTDPTSRVRQHAKDAAQILEQARDSETPSPLMSQVGLLAQAAMAQGLHDADNAAVVEVLRGLAGLAAPLTAYRTPD